MNNTLYLCSYSHDHCEGYIVVVENVSDFQKIFSRLLHSVSSKFRCIKFHYAIYRPILLSA